MWKLLRGFSLVSSKIVATFFMVIFMMLLGFAFFPDLLNRLSDFTNWIEGNIRDPDMDERGKFLFRHHHDADCAGRRGIHLLDQRRAVAAGESAGREG